MNCLFSEMGSSENRLKITAVERNHWDSSRMKKQSKNLETLLLNDSKCNILLMFYNQFFNTIQDLAILLSQIKSDDAEFFLLFREEKQLTLCITNLGKASSSDEVSFQPNLKNVVAPNSNISEIYFEIGSC